MAVALAVVLGLATPAAATTAPPSSDGVVLIGVGGLHWTDVDRSTTPTLWRMVTTGSVGSISVRTSGPRTCPLDAWGTLSAGRRWAPPEEQSTGLDGQGIEGESTGEPEDLTDDCASLPAVTSLDAVEGEPSDSVVEEWSTVIAPPVVAEDGEAEGDPAADSAGVPGTVAARIAEQGACSTAVGPGAALALADSTGRVERYLPSMEGLDASTLAQCRVVLVDAGVLDEDRAARQDALVRLDVRLGRLLDELPEDRRVIVAGVSDSLAVDEGLPFVVDWERTSSVGWLTSDSTRRAGIVTLADLAATAVDSIGGDLTDFDGAALSVAADRRMSTERTVENRRYLTEMTTTVTHVMPVFVAVVALAGLGAGLALALARRRSAAGPSPATRRPVTAVLLLAAAAPGGAFLAALSRWWVTPAPMVGAAVSAAVATVLLALLAWGLSRLLRAGPWRLAGASAGLTWLLLTVDGLTGTVLQQGSILGSTPTFGARFYGFGNLTFSVYAVTALVLAGHLAAAARRSGRPRAAVAAVLGVGLLTVVVDGWPGFGADVGGILALVPAVVVLALGVAGMRLTPQRVLAAAVLGAVATAVVGVVDWLGPWPASHLGLFVERVVDGQGWATIAGKAASAFATVANPAGAIATLVCLALGVLLVGPARYRPARVRAAYESWPLLRPVVGAIVVVATLGTLLNDSGIAVAVVVLGLGAALLTVSGLAHADSGDPDSGAVDSGDADSGDPAPGGAAAPDQGQAPGGTPVRRMPAVLLAAGGGLLAVLLLGVGLVPLPAAAAGDVTDGTGTAVAPHGAPVVVVGTSGVRWQDVDPVATPTLWSMVRDGAAVAGVAPGVTGVNGRCLSGGWLSISTGRAPITRGVVDEEWRCLPWSVVPEATAGASVDGWSTLAQEQSRSEFDPRLGVLAESLDGAGVCATAVGPGAALALADPEGHVARYVSLDDALADPTQAFDCPVTVVDLGAVPYLAPTANPDPDADPLAPAATTDGTERTALLAEVDADLRRVLSRAPAGATVLLVDVGNPAQGPVSLGVGAAQIMGDEGAHFLSTPSTRWQGVVRLLDVPTTVLAAVGAPNPVEYSGSPLTIAGTRSADVAVAVDQLVDLSVRDQALRGQSGTVTTIPLLIALALLGAVAGLPRLAAGRPRAARGLRRLVDAGFLVLASLPAGLYLMTTWSWWRADSPTTMLWLALAASTALVAGVAALAPRQPVWAAPAVISTITFLVLTVDAVLGTPLHRGSPLGPAPTLGGRYYGFGNPTYSIYVVAALVAAACLGAALAARGRRVLAVVVAGGVALVALAVDLLPTLGADVGGGLVLLPAAAVVVLAVAGARVTWRRLGLITLLGVVAVGVIGYLDWLRPATDRSHLGRFVQSALDGTAGETVLRKAGYAASSLSSGPTAWLTLALLVLVIGLVWPGSRWRPRWYVRVEESWPMVRPLLVGLLVAAVGGSLANDYGTRIATVLLAAAVPLVGLLALRADREDEPSPEVTDPAEVDALG